MSNGGIPIPGQRRKQVLPSPPTPPPKVKVVKLSIVNIIMPSANTEYSWQLPMGLKSFTLHVRDGTAIRISTFSDKVAGSNEPYFTLKTDTSWTKEDLDVQGADSFLYFACGTAGKVIEILVEVEQWV